MTTNNPNTVLNASSANGLRSNDNKALFQIPAVVAPRKIIVPVSSFGGQTVAANCPPLKRFVNGECKSNTIGISQPTVLINTLSTGKSPVTIQTSCGGTSAGTVVSAIVCPHCGHHSKYLDQCEICKKAIAHLGPTVSVIRPVRSLATFLCSTSNNSVTLMPSKTTTTCGGSAVNTTTSLLRTRPSIITKSVPVIPMGTFYGDKHNSNQIFRPNSTIESSITKTVTKISQKSPKPKQPHPRKQPAKRPAEPECLTLSSDEDEASSQSSISTNTSVLENEISTTGNSISDTNEVKQFVDTDENGEKVSLCASSDCSTSANEPIKNNFHTYCQDPANGGIRLMCRSIRIGSYKIQSPDPPALALDITEDKISFSVPVVPNENESVNITINRTQLASILACFEKRLFVLFLYTDAPCGTVIREKLKMSKDSVYYDPTSPEETKKRITILPANISDAERNYLRKVFEKPKMVELGQNKANEILVRSTPVGNGGSQHMVRLSVADGNTVITRSKDVESSESANEIVIVKLVTYPPPPQTGGILVTSEDLLCLNEGEYLNDVIIDFYLKCK